MSQLALDLGVPSTLVTEAVYARCLSAMKDARVRAQQSAGRAGRQSTRAIARSSSSRSARPSTPRRFAATPRASCRCRPRPKSTSGRWISARSRCCGAAAASSARSSWSGSRRRSTPTPSWKTCCWPRTSQAATAKAQAAWRHVVATAVQLGIPMPAFATALAYYDGYRAERLPANLLQAQRDYFGAHTYQRHRPARRVP